MSDNAIFILMVMARALHYGAALALFGLCTFVGFLLPTEDGAPNAHQSTLQNILRYLTAVLVIGTVLQLSAEAALAGDGLADAIHPTIILSLLLETGFGHAWIIQCVLAAVMAVVAFRPGSTRWRALAILSGCALVGLAAVGHAISFSGPLLFAVPLAQALHLLAAGFWLGGLIAIALRPTQSNDNWQRALMSFSSIGHFAVAIAFATGGLISFAILSHQSTPWNSLYLVTLFIKIALVLIMTGLAVFNRYYFVPRISKTKNFYVLLTQVVRINIVISGLVVVLVSLLGNLAPANA